MTTRDDLDQQLDAFLRGGPLELPTPSFDAVRADIEQTRQRVGIGPWRTPNMNRTVTFGLGAAAVVVIAVVGYQVLGSPNVGSGGDPTPTPEASVTGPSPSSPVTGDLAEGPHVLSDGGLGGGGAPVTVTISAPGWSGDGGILVKDSVDPPDGAGIIVFGGPLYVYGDPCHWSTTTPDAPATTIDELVAALASQASRDASAIVDITVDGHAARWITLHVPDDVVLSACDRGEFRSWVADIEEDYARYHQGPGQIDEVWIVDVDGVITVIDANYFPQTAVDDLDELHALIDSVTFN